MGVESADIGLLNLFCFPGYIFKRGLWVGRGDGSDDGTRVDFNRRGGCRGNPEPLCSFTPSYLTPSSKLPYSKNSLTLESLPAPFQPQPMACNTCKRNLFALYA